MGSAFETRLRLDLGNIQDVGLHTLKHGHAKLLVGHLTATEAQGHLDLVAFLEEPFDRAHLHVVVVIIDARTHLDLFDFDDLLLLSRLGLLLLLLELEFSIVQDLGYRRVGIG